MAEEKNTDFLRFSAYSMKDMIIRKLSEDANFTDQVYEGSNLNTLIDIIAYMYQCLVYQLNSAAAESMFSDAQIYTNISRLVSLIGYNPKGCIASQCTFSFDNTSNMEDGAIVKKNYGKCIPPYSTIDTGLIDSNGKKIYYSTTDANYVDNSDVFKINMVNGKWKMYSSVITASGTDYESFTLDDLCSDNVNQKYVMWPYIDVYVKTYDNTTQKYVYTKWTCVTDGLFIDQNVSNGVQIYNSSDKIYNLRLNEDKTYEIKFGNGTNGQKLNAGDELIIMYLDGNGEDAELDSISQVYNVNLMHNAGLFGMSGTVYESIFEQYLVDAFTQDELKEILLANSSVSTSFLPEESVSEIREQAPQWFKMGNRLITQTDYEYYIKMRYKGNVIDVKAMNNWEYISTFYRWLYDIGNNKRNNPKYYLNENNLIKYDYKYADACDSNNIYCWVKMRNNLDIYIRTLKNDITNIKTLTSEPIFIEPILVNFMVSAMDEEELKLLMSQSDVIQDQNSYIEILLTNTTLYTNDILTSRINSIIKDFFKEDNFEIGEKVDYNELLNQIYQIDGIERIQTVYSYTNDDNEIKFKRVNGISFATWSNTLIRDGDDLEVTNTSRVLQPFQFPQLFDVDLTNKIKVIKRNTNLINNIQY